MADSFHFSISMISRGKGKSAVASAAYISCEKITNEWDGITHDYRNKKGLLHSEIFLPENIPIQLKDRTTLWNSVELNEKAINAQLARNLLFELPRELSEKDRINLISEFIEENFTSKGMIADCNIHNPLASDNEEQPHAHILLTLREIDEKGNWKAKSRKEYILDENGEKIKLKSGNYKSRKVNLNDWNDPDKAKEWRENFSKKANEYLEKNNIQKRIDPRTFEEQGREEIPTIHMGASASALERQGIKTDKGNLNREIKNHNALVKAIRERISELSSWIGGLIGSLQSKYDEYKQEKKEEYENKAELFDLYEYISIYYDLQGEKARELNPYAKNKKTVADLKRFAKARIYLLDNKLKTIADLQEKIAKLQSEYGKIRKEVKAKTSRIENLNKCFAYADIIKDNKAVYDEWNTKTLFKDSFYNSHKDEIDKYKRARRMLEKFNGSSAIKIKDWEKEIHSLESEIGKLNRQSQAIKDEYENTNHIKYAVGIVNEEYGIELSIEIDKAIKRGEKESVIKKLQEFKKDSDSYNRKRQATKDYYKNKDMER